MLLSPHSKSFGRRREREFTIAVGSLCQRRIMRLTEYFDFIKRTDIGIASNPKPLDYYYFSPWTEHKRQRYLYQCELRGKKPVK
tara:strand:+ start:67 stop:318 length:252 start_codon:yes stop_codon:yes gene_type:complete